jgi:Ca-activated chloride channel family protein
VSSLATKIASPVLTDLTLRGGAAEFYDVEPANLPDLFAGEELVMFGRVRGAGSGEQAVTITGRRNGREERFSTTARFGAEEAGTDYVPQLWAARKAGTLAREIRLRGANPELVGELKRLALRYGILTEYTSYLVQEPNPVVIRPGQDRPLPVPAPQDQVGLRAVESARAQSAMAGSLQLGAVTQGAVAIENSSSAAGRPGARPAQRVGSRVFVWRDSTWTDIAHTDSLKVVSVAAFSDAYFALLHALPELVKPATLAPAVLVAGRRVSIKIEARGTATWREGELVALVRDFRS